MATHRIRILVVLSFLGLAILACSTIWGLDAPTIEAPPRVDVIESIGGLEATSTKIPSLTHGDDATLTPTLRDVVTVIPTLTPDDAVAETPAPTPGDALNETPTLTLCEAAANGEGDGCRGGTTQAECSNAGLHCYSQIKMEYGCEGADDGVYGFLITFGPNTATVASVEYEWEFVHTRIWENTYSREVAEVTDREMTIRLTFEEDGYTQETIKDGSVCLKYIRTRLD